MMKLIKQTSLQGALLFAFATALPAADLHPIRWVIQDGQQADTIQAERIYEAACAWIEDHFAIDRTPIKPTITIHVGESCPDAALTKACFSPATSDLYLPKWEETSPSSIAHASLIAGLMQLMNRDQIRQTVAKLINADAQNFVSARTASREGNTFSK